LRLETARMVLRPFVPTDLDELAALNADPEAMRYFEAPFSLAQSREFLRRYMAGQVKNGFHFSALEHKPDGQFIGILGPAAIAQPVRAQIPGQPEIEIGWRLHRQVWGKGLATEGAMACLQYAWQTLKAPEIVAFTATANKASRRVMEKTGMAFDPDGGFEHPSVSPGHPLRTQVLYRIANPNRSG
jgi:RimJ/RimL family protein N-acetyltransferase